MFNWCSYCQKYTGQSAPFNDFTVSHGICQKCLTVHHGIPSTNSDNVMKIANFFGDLWNKALTDQAIDAKAALDEARALKISDSDILLGILQPVLIRIGDAFESGEITVDCEHRFSRSVNRIISLMNLDQENTAPIDVLILNADENFHTIGPYFLKAILRENDIQAQVVIPCVPLPEVPAFIEKISPLCIGLSVAVDSHLEYLEAFPKVAGYRKIYVGGPALQTEETREKYREKYPAYTIIDIDSFIKEVLLLKVDAGRV